VFSKSFAPSLFTHTSDCFFTVVKTLFFRHHLISPSFFTLLVLKLRALSRSAQFWSSYSGYLREVSQLCFAFRRWSEIDSAKSIYKEIVEQKKGLLETLKRQADIREKRDNEGWERLQKVGKEVEGVGDQWKESFKVSLRF